MSRVIVAGDYITDEIYQGKSDRLCPGTLAPVIVKAKPTEERPGGCGLVAAQLKELLGKDSVETVSGSISRKEYIYSNGELACRRDWDGTVKTPDFLRDRVLELLTETNAPDLLVISDYGKGALNAESAKRIMDMAASKEVPVLVDAKHTWDFYRGAWAMFPNERESFNSVHFKGTHIIQKLGDRGCLVNGEIVPPEFVKSVRDTTGAGDCFIAAFAANLLEWDMSVFPTDAGRLKSALLQSARYANRVAGKSVEFFGTHAVSRHEFEDEI